MTRSQNLDIGATSGDEAKQLGAAAGDTVTVAKAFRRLLGSRITGRALDDRAGCAVLLRALWAVAADVPKINAGGPVWVVFSVEEEIGLVGAEKIAQGAGPRRVYPIDSFVTSDSPLETGRACNSLGDGSSSGDYAGYEPAEVERVAALARVRESSSVRITSGGKWLALRAGGSVVPELAYAIHTAAESHTRDLEALTMIVTALIREELTVRP
jgi:putative aminopeptidase FrvX